MALTPEEQKELDELEKTYGSTLTPSEEKELAELEASTQGINPITSGVRKLAQGLTGGFSDELAGVLESAGAIGGVKGLGGDISKISYEGNPTLDLDVLKKAYSRGRDLERENLSADEAANPVISKTADLAGAFTSPINKIMGGSSLVKQGLVAGGLGGLGTSEGKDYKEILKDTLLGTSLGGGIPFVGGKAAPLISKYVTDPISGKLTAGAEWAAAKSLGAERGTIKQIGYDEVKKIGRYAHDNKMISPLASTDDLIKRNEAMKKIAADARNAVYSKIDNANASTFNPSEVAGEVETKVGDFWRSPINRGEVNQLENTLESITMRGENPISLKEAQKLKEELGKVANWKNNINITDKEKMARDAYGVVANNIERSADEAALSLGDEALSSILNKNNKLYSAGKGAEKLLENKEARERGNKLIGLTDWGLLGGGAGAAYMNPSNILPIAATFAAKKGLERFGPQNAALFLDKFGKTVKNVPEYTKSNSPLMYPYLLMNDKKEK